MQYLQAIPLLATLGTFRCLSDLSSSFIISSGVVVLTLVVGTCRIVEGLSCTTFSFVSRLQVTPKNGKMIHRKNIMRLETMNVNSPMRSTRKNSNAAALGAVTRSVAWHLGHMRPRLLYLAFTSSRLPQLGHLNTFFHHQSH